METEKIEDYLYRFCVVSISMRRSLRQLPSSRLILECQMQTFMHSKYHELALLFEMNFINLTFYYISLVSRITVNELEVLVTND